MEFWLVVSVAWQFLQQAGAAAEMERIESSPGTRHGMQQLGTGGVAACFAEGQRCRHVWASPSQLYVTGGNVVKLCPGAECRSCCKFHPEARPLHEPRVQFLPAQSMFDSCCQSYVDTDVGTNFMTSPAGGRTRRAPSDCCDDSPLTLQNGSQELTFAFPFLASQSVHIAAQTTRGHAEGALFLPALKQGAAQLIQAWEVMLSSVC